MASARWGWKSNSEPLVSQVVATGRELPRGWLGKLPAWEVTRSGAEAAFQVSVRPSGTTGVLLGSLEKRNPYL